MLAVLLALTLVATFWPQGEPDDAVVEAVHDRPAAHNEVTSPEARERGGSSASMVARVSASASERATKRVTESAVAYQKGKPSHGDKHTTEFNAEPRLASDIHRNLFPIQTYKPPPPKPEPPSPPPPPPPPTAPAVPFVFLGAWTEEGRETLFLGRGEQTFTVQRGELLPGGWRLDDVSPEALTFTYISLNQQRILRIAP